MAAPPRTRVALAALLLLAAACAPGVKWEGDEIIPAMPKPDFALANLDGSPYRFRASTDGHLTLLFFGYTMCPDVCPVQLASIAGAVGALSPEERARVRVVFVTTDPDRDTPERMRQWLDHFQVEVTGVRGPVEAVHAAERAAGVAQSVPGADSLIGHANRVLAFSPDDSLRIAFSQDISRDQWTAGLRHLLEWRSSVRQ